MSLELTILASGSFGNCSVIRSPAGVLLLDLGIGPRVTARRLQGTGVTLPDISAACLTHLDGDHLRPTWASTILRQQIRIFCHAARRKDLLNQLNPGPHDADNPPPPAEESLGGFAPLVHTFRADPFEPLPGLTVEPLHLPHDRQGSHGFIIEGFGSRIGYATDLGRVPPALLDRFCNLDILAIESNYDPVMQETSNRPPFLKRRIMGGAGHLSNFQALAAVRAALDRAESCGETLPAHIVLLHRSRECNCPKLLRKLFHQDQRIAQRLTLAEQFERTQWLRPRHVQPAAGEQLLLAWH
jgi:phosphoribosyl 1,2-cyclic phosphodiesterase